MLLMINGIYGCDSRYTHQHFYRANFHAMPAAKDLAETLANQTELSALADRYARGDETVLPELTPRLYDELRRIAYGQIRQESSAHTLQATAVVHEAYLRLSQSADVRVQGHTHFVRLASRVMRNVLVDHARSNAAIKRGGDVDITSLDRTALAFHTRCAGRLFTDTDTDPHETAIANELNFVALDTALEQLRSINPRQAEVVDLRFFSDLSIEETADALGVSIATIKRDWSVARLFLQQAMAG